MGRLSKNFLLTAFESIEIFKNKIINICDKYAYQLERCPNTNKEHVQAYIKTTNPIALSELKSILGNNCHIETTRNPAAAIKYCTKENTRVEGPWLHNITIKKHDIEEIKEICKKGDIMSLREKHFGFFIRYRRSLVEECLLFSKFKAQSTTKGIWLWGPSGCGKTKFVYDLGNVYFKNPNKWWDGYLDQDVVCGDDWDDKIWSWGLHYIKNWTDCYPVRGETKGGTISLNFKYFIVTSNVNLELAIRDIPIDHKEAIRRRFKEFYANLDGLSLLNDFLSLQSVDQRVQALSQQLPEDCIQDIQCMSERDFAPQYLPQDKF